MAPGVSVDPAVRSPPWPCAQVRPGGQLRSLRDTAVHHPHRHVLLLLD